MTEDTRLLPHNIEAEQAVLGSMMIDANAAQTGVMKLDANDFYREAHETMFICLKDINDRNDPVDMISLTEELRKHNALESCGGTNYIIACHETVPTARNIDYYCGVVKEKAFRRRVIERMNRVIEKCYDPMCEDPEAEFQLAIQKIVSEARSIWRDTKGATMAAVEIRDWKSTDGRIRFGLHKLDMITNGIGPGGELTIIGARPSNGKSAMLNRYALNALNMGGRVLYYSLETSAEVIVKRMASDIGSVDEWKLIHHRFNSDEEEQEAVARFYEALSTIHNYDDCLMIQDNCNALGKIQATAKQAVLKHAGTEAPVMLIIVDYLQLVDSGWSRDERIKVKKSIEALKRLSLQLKVPLIVASQLRRAGSGEKERIPSLDDLAETGASEAEADKVILIQNPPPTTDNDFDSPRPVVLRVAKYKNGRTGDVPCQFRGPYLRFEAISE